MSATRTHANNGNDPTGLFIDTSQKYQISTTLGRGACGSVHALVKRNKKKDSSTSTKISIPYVVKIATLPNTNTNTRTTNTTNKKRKKTAVEKNADLLNHENVLYRNVLNELRGVMVPDVPVAGSTNIHHCSNLPGFGDMNGSASGASGDNTSSSCSYRFLVMERMEASFTSLIPTLYHSHSQHSKKKTSNSYISIPIGHVASRLISLMEAIHDTQHVFVDVKPDNFMLASSASTETVGSKKKTTTTTTTTTTKKSKTNGGGGGGEYSQIRMIDFGLVESTRDVMKNKHRQNQYPNGQVVGTPTYLSLNVLDGHTVSRRDDVEAVGYVLLEMILQLRHYGAAAAAASGKSTSTSTSSGKKKVKKLHDVEQDLLPWSKATSDDEIKVQKESAMEGTDGGIFWNDMIGDFGADDDIRDTMREFMNVIRDLQFKERPDYDMLRTMLSTLKVKVQSSPAASSAVSTSTSASASATESTPPKRRRVGRDKKIAAKSTSTSISSRKTNIVDSDDDDDDDDDEVIVPSKLSARAARAAARHAAKSSQEEESSCYEDVIEVHSSDDDDVEMVYVGDDDDDHDHHHQENSTGSNNTSSDNENEMEWELVAGSSNHENESSISNSMTKATTATTTTATKKKKLAKKKNSGKKGHDNGNDDEDDQNTKEPASPSLRLVCTDGPHEGEDIILTGTLILGQSPNQRGNNQTYALSEDAETSASHAKLVLIQSGGGSKKNKLLMVRVHDLKSTNGTMVNQKVLPKGGSRQAFVKDTVQVGNSTFTILKH